MPLSLPKVVDAGVRRASESGVEGVGIRAVATDLDVTPMALYRYVADADALQHAVIDRILADLPEVECVGPWDERCRRWAHATRRVIADVPGLAKHILLHWFELPSVLVAVDGLVGTLEREGPEGVDAVAGANAVLTYTLMRAQAEEAVRTDGRTRDLDALRSRKSELSHLWRHRNEYRSARFDEHFAYGLDALLAGIAVTRRSA